MAPVDPDKYRKESMGTYDKTIAKAVNELSKFDYSTMSAVNSYMDVLLRDPNCISKLLELRSRRTMESLNSYGDFKPDAIFTDFAILTALQNKGYDFSNFKIDINNNLGGKPNNVDLNGLLEAIQQGIENKKGKEFKVLIPNPENESETLDFRTLVSNIKEREEQNSISNFEVARQE